MTTRYPAGLAALAISALFVACTTDSEPHMLGIQANRFATSEWSEPVHLGPIVNSSANDANAALSPDEPALYLVTTRTAGRVAISTYTGRIGPAQTWTVMNGAHRKTSALM